MSSNNYTQSLLQSMSIIAEQTVKNANYDRTIQATIVSCVDPTIGKYKVNYQNGTWYAYSNNINTKYVKGSTVYILIPEGNMNNTKTILGTTKQLGINYISTVEEIEKYAVNGNSVTTDSTTHNLCSYTVVTTDITSSLGINNNAAKTYFKKSSHFIASMLVRTNLPPQQRYNGNYGLNFYLNFANSTTGETITRVYTFDIDSMQGNPYLYPNGMVQKTFFEIDGANFLGISKIQMFVRDFPNQTTGKPNDIFFSNISIYGAEVLSDEELNGVALVLNAPKGYIFNSSSAAADTRTINAQVRVLGKAIDNNSQKLAYYWFVQDCSITSKSALYCKYGGQGWKCLNKYKKYSDGRYEFNPAAATLSIKKSDVTIKQQKYKCAVIYDNTTISKQFSIHNDDAKYNITVTSDKGTEFVKDTGYPTLTCNVTGSSTSGFKYNWSETTSTGVFKTLSDQTSDYNIYKKALDDYNSLKTGFANGTKLKNAYFSGNTKNIEKYTDLERELKDKNIIQYVTNNKIVHLNVKNITNFSTFSCSVFNSESALIGTASITIVNKATSNGGYSLVINNGSQVFNYDENGISPCHTSQAEPLVIPSLSFTLYDMKGQEVSQGDKGDIKANNVSWIIPIKNTMLSVSDEGSTDPNGETKTVTGFNLTYTIAQKYAINKGENDIQLRVNYHGYVLTAKTNFTFTKEGQLGTNGTGLTLKIVPYSGDNEITNYPIATTTNGTSYSYNFTSLHAQLWNNGELIFNNNKTGNTTDSKSAVVTWSILRNRYTSSIYDNSSFSINAEGTVSSNPSTSTNNTSVNLFNLYTQLNGNRKTGTTALNNMPANIIKLTVVYDKITYYATLPIITVYKNSSASKFSATLVPNTGFRYAVYSDDGRFPLYDNHQPFTIRVNETINSSSEDISTSNVSGHKPSYKYGIIGQYYQNDTRKFKTYLKEPKEQPEGKPVNTYYVKPQDTYDGLCVTNAVYSIVTIGSAVLFIHIPVHFMLNKYGNAALNNWDGNSIRINDTEGVILAPQVGAGKKDDDNSFTGILMGEVKKTNSSTTQTGLFGYSKGARSIFLDADTGNAIFGKTGAGQIKIDAGTNEGTIQSGDYNNSAGMKIKFSSTGSGAQKGPYIKFGSGHFSVDSSGNITAKDGGTIAGWSIGAKELTNDKVGISANKTSDSSIAFWAGAVSSNKANAKFKVDYAGNITAQGKITATSGDIGSGSDKIHIGQGAIYTGQRSTFGSTATTGFYIGKNGISLGGYDKDLGSCAFQVSKQGALIARSGYIGTSAGGFKITSTAITKNKENYKDNNSGVYIGTSGIGLGKGTFYVDSNGALHATSGDVGGWKLTSNAIRSADNVEYNGKTGMYFGSAGIRLGENFHVDSNGNLWANKGDFTGIITTSKGKIGNWIIDETGIKNNSDTVTLYPSKLTLGKFYANSDGKIGNSDGSWYIEANGKAHFNNMNMSGGTISGNSKMTGGSIGSSSGGGPTVYPGSCGWGGNPGKTLEQWGIKIADGEIEAYKGTFESLITTKIDATYIHGKISNMAVLNAKGISASSWITCPNIKVGSGENEGNQVATKSWVNTQQFLTSGDLSNYATQTWVNGKGYATEGYVNGQLLSYATQTWVRNNFQPKS